jgi:hypothetical protein
MENNCFVYIYRRKDNDIIFYIGRGKHKSPTSKYIRAGNIKKHNPYTQNVASKYGFYYTIIKDDITFEQSCEVEKKLIDKIGLENLTNITLGGEGTLGLTHWKGKKHKLETIQKMSLAHKGKIKTPKQIESTRNHAKGNKYNLGKKRTLEQIENIRLGQLNRKDNNRAMKKVCNENGLIFDSAKQASIYLNLNTFAVSTAIRKNVKCGGYKWQYC